MGFTKFFDPKNDYAFKRIFGLERNKDILIPFLNQILEFEEGKQIIDVTFLKTSQDPAIAYAKQSIVDVLCRDEKGDQYIIEMQVVKTSGFEKRAQYYAAKAYGSQIQQGEPYDGLNAIIFIAITDFVMFPHKKDYKSTHVILDRKSFEHDLKDFSFTFLELPKFDKEIHELQTPEERWMYFFKHAPETSKEDLDAITGNNEAVKLAYDEMNKYNWSEIEFNTYEQEVKRELDNRAVEQAKLAAAREEVKRNTVLAAHKEGLSLDVIHKVTGLPIEKIQEIIQEKEKQ